MATPPIVVTSTGPANPLLEARVTALELGNQAIRAEFDAFRMTSNAQIQALQTMVEAFKMTLQARGLA